MVLLIVVRGAFGAPRGPYNTDSSPETFTAVMVFSHREAQRAIEYDVIHIANKELVP